jgi:Ca-activated chloride channel family protein
VEAAREVTQAGIVVHTIGMGTTQGGPIPIMRGGRLQGFKKDKDGNTVVTRMNEAMLQQVAAAGGGTYTRATPAGDGLLTLMDQLKEMEAGTSEGGYHFTAYDDQFQYPLAIGLLLVCAALCIDLRRRTPLYIAFHA